MIYFHALRRENQNTICSWKEQKKAYAFFDTVNIRISCKTFVTLSLFGAFVKQNGLLLQGKPLCRHMIY